MFLIKKILDNSTHNSAESKQDNQKKKKFKLEIENDILQEIY